MKLRKAPALEGFQWAKSGVMILRQQPLAHVALLLAMSMSLGLLASLPWIGPVAALVLLPSVSAGWVFSSATVLAGVRTTPGRLIAPLASPRRTALLQLGVLHMLACVAVLWVADLLDPAFRTALGPALGNQDGVSEEAAMQALDQVRSGMLMRGAMLLPVALVFWHAPVILHRIGGPVARALFASALATWRNLAAFVVYGVSWLVADLMLSSAVGLVAAAIGQPQIVLLLVLPAAVLFAAAFYASLHASVHACIDFDEITRAQQATPAEPAP
ncbi:MAG: hypothetical protein RL375_1165 [Pseudomonadota bacterium]